MTAKTAQERKAEQRARDKLKEEERLARLLARTIRLDLFKATDMELIRLMVRLGIEEEADVISRLIRGADRLSDADLNALTQL